MTHSHVCHDAQPLQSGAAGKGGVEESEVDTSPWYAIPWIDYLARAVPHNVAASGLQSGDMRFILQHCLRIPASRNVPSRQQR